MAKSASRSSKPATPANYGHVLGHGQPSNQNPGAGTPVVRSSPGSDNTHTTTRAPQTSHAGGKPAPSGNW